MKGLTLIVKTATRLVIGFIFLFGVYLVLYGHLSPGGGFSGGVILGSTFVLGVLALGQDAIDRVLPRGVAHVFDSIGALGFLGIALAGYTAGYFFVNFISKGQPFHLVSAGAIPLSNIAIGVKVGAGIFVAFAALAAFRMNGKSTGS